MKVDQKTKTSILIVTVLGGIGVFVYSLLKDKQANKSDALNTGLPSTEVNFPNPQINLPKTQIKTNPSGSTVSKPTEVRLAVTLKDTMMYKSLKPGLFSLYNSLADELGEMPKGYYIGRVVEIEDSSNGYVKLSRLIGGKTYYFYVLKNDFYFGGANIKYILPTDKYTLPTTASTKSFLSNWIQF